MGQTERTGDHLERGDMLAWMDGESTPERGAAIRTHLGVCGECSARLRHLRESAALLSDALRTADAPRPGVSPDAVRRRAAVRRLSRSVPAAAALVLLFATGALALVPGSPLRSWMGGQLHRPASPEPAQRPETVARLSVAAPDSVEVVLEEPHDLLELRIVRSAGPRLEVGTRPEDTLAGLDFGKARLRVDPGSARLLRIVLPERSRFRILFRGRVLSSATAGRPRPELRDEDSVTVLRVDPSRTGSGR